MVGPPKSGKTELAKRICADFGCKLVSVESAVQELLESAPGASDYRPMALHPGQALRFNGYECRHYTLENQTDASRVSFDLRCIPASSIGEGEQPPSTIGEYACQLMRMEDTHPDSSDLADPPGAGE